MAGITDSGNKTTDLTFMARLIGGVKFALTGKTPGSDVDSVPFSPGQPLQPVFQDDMQGRQWDYPTGYNLRYVPRQDTAISFRHLRELADKHDDGICRRAAELAPDMNILDICYLTIQTLSEHNANVRKIFFDLANRTPNYGIGTTTIPIQDGSKK